jgi:hypothetical protein
MTAGQFRQCRDTIGWPQVRLAEELDVTPLRIRKWAHGSEQVPEVVASWMRAFAAEVKAAYERHQPPRGRVPGTIKGDPGPEGGAEDKRVRSNNAATLRRLQAAHDRLRERQLGAAQAVG